MKREELTYGQAIQNLYAELDSQGIELEGFYQDGYDLTVAERFSNFVSVAQGQEDKPLDKNGKKIFEDCEIAITDLAKRRSESKSIEDLFY